MPGAAFQHTSTRKDGEEPVQIKVEEEALASLLLEVYSEKPHVIAEAIMALKKAGDGRERWLNEVLGTRPELRELARRVHQELTGE